MNVADISIIGQDRKWIVEAITNYIFNNICNVEEVNQNVMNNIFYMSVKISFKPEKFDKGCFYNPTVFGQVTGEMEMMNV